MKIGQALARIGTLRRYRQSGYVDMWMAIKEGGKLYASVTTGTNDQRIQHQAVYLYYSHTFRVAALPRCPRCRLQRFKVHMHTTLMYFYSLLMHEY
jgi:hypothetical protein